LVNCTCLYAPNIQIQPIRNQMAVNKTNNNIRNIVTRIAKLNIRVIEIDFNLTNKKVLKYINKHSKYAEYIEGYLPNNKSTQCCKN